ncbi:hypothetical protein PN36_14165 [Candidatus Thiomargarita nelsonii]|uniref:Asparagine synthetase domain-containing protein n=1 Tax=Candidatus Thiomargarita nelsonii TaxID=1003181 RepID=A0A4E0QP49_9GAMM|nr:hypothetical protein PN36_14165 [Candidatus Thiomargarita nelsonii]
MYKNQYIVTKKQKSNFHNIKPVHFLNDLYIYSCLPLSTSNAQYLSTEVFLIGYILNPLKPADSNDDIVIDLAKRCKTQALFLKNIQVLSGRYILFYKNETSFIVVSDACSLRQCYFKLSEGETILTSSPKMFLDFYDYDLQINDLKRDLINLPHYKKNESLWYGDKCIDDRLRKLLPNHYLDLNNKVLKRLDLYTNILDEKNVIDYASSILKGTFAALVSRYNLVQPLTGGWDSRILLAASKEFKEKIQFYVFNRSDGSPDVWVPNKLSQKLELRFETIKPSQLRSDFISLYNQEHLFPRILPKTANIQYHYDNNRSPNIINVNGNCAEIVRCFYGYTSKKISLEMLLLFSEYPQENEFVKMELKEWLVDATEYSKNFDIPVLDLFYWEQRMGNWGALAPFEQDIAIEEISPFNNRSLIATFLKVHPIKSPDYKLFRKLIQALWADTLREPINPGENRLKKIIKGNSLMMYYVLKAKRVFRKF